MLNTLTELFFGRFYGLCFGMKRLTEAINNFGESINLSETFFVQD